MYVPLVWCVDFINLCVFLCSKRITVFLIYFSLISSYIRAPWTPFPFRVFFLCVFGKPALPFFLSHKFNQILRPWRERQQPSWGFFLFFSEAVTNLTVVSSHKPDHSWGPVATETHLQAVFRPRNWTKMKSGATPKI